MKQFGYSVADDLGSSGRRSARMWPSNHPGYIVGTLGNSYDDTVYLQASPVPGKTNWSTRTTVLINTGIAQLHQDDQSSRPALKDGSVPAVGRVHLDLHEEVHG